MPDDPEIPNEAPPTEEPEEELPPAVRKQIEYRRQRDENIARLRAEQPEGDIEPAPEDDGPEDA